MPIMGIKMPLFLSILFSHLWLPPPWLIALTFWPDLNEIRFDRVVGFFETAGMIGPSMEHGFEVRNLRPNYVNWFWSAQSIRTPINSSGYSDEHSYERS